MTNTALFPIVLTFIIIFTYELIIISSMVLLMKTRHTIFWVVFFSIAMGFMEAAVVIYLRKIYYPGGFAFPLTPIDHNIAITEICREAATIIMLVAIGRLAGKNRAERFAYFILSFAVWDILYYVFLWLFLGWPSSLFTWDILFLIPVVWVGPVLTPIIISCTMILFALTTIYFSARGYKAHMHTRERLLLLLGALIVIVSFTEDYIRVEGSVLYHNLISGGSLLSDLSSYVPVHFNWFYFLLGEGVLLVSYFLYVKRVTYK